ncbi:MAG: preprotein translocase subunit SecG [Solirubrobacteraceae bacterium]
MESIFTVLMVLIVLLCICLVLVILVQNPKGGGLSSTFGATSSQTFGVQETNDFLNRATWVLSSSIVVLIFVSSILMSRSVNAKKDIAPSSIQKEVPAENTQSKKK